MSDLQAIEDSLSSLEAPLPTEYSQPLLREVLKVLGTRDSSDREDALQDALLRVEEWLPGAKELQLLESLYKVEYSPLLRLKWCFQLETFLNLLVEGYSLTHDQA
jgi:hypothetical protein